MEVRHRPWAIIARPRASRALGPPEVPLSQMRHLLNALNGSHKIWSLLSD